MATTEERIAVLEQSILDLNTAINQLREAFVAKLQWKQLDTVRAAEVVELKNQLAALTVRVTNLENAT